MPKATQDPSGFNSLSMWMRPPSGGWKSKKVRKKGKGQSRPLGILAIILILVGFIGLMMVKHAADTALLFQGIGDLHRQATYISELSTPPVAPARLLLVLDEFSSFIHKLDQDLEKPLLIGGLSLPGHSSKARAAVTKLKEDWHTIYRPTLTKALSSVGMGASVAVRENSKALVDEIESISQEVGNISLSGGSQLFLIQVGLLMIGAMLTIRLLMSVQHELLEPMDHMRNWASRMREGNLATRIPIPLDGDFVELAHNINALSDELQTLVREQKSQVQHQHDLLSQKTRSLSTLYNVAESLNAPEDIDQHISRFMGVLADVVDAKAGIARLRNEGDEMRLVASMGVNAQVIERQQLVSMEQCLCDDDMTSTQLSRPRDFEIHTGLNIEDVLPNLSKENGVVLTVPMLYKDQNLGVYNFFVEKSSVEDWSPIRDLLTSIGQHLGVAIHQSRLDLQDKRLSIMQERAMLAHELHDSLAQILASLGFQVRMLEDSLTAVDPQEQVRQDLNKLRAGVDEANKELRQLLVNFRATYDERGLVPSLEKLVDGFQQESEIQAFFHNECQDIALAPDEEIQVLHIVQEALTNARKHSGAKTVRVLLGCDNQGSYRVLVEDDGKGLATRSDASPEGEHLGLSIMKERSFYLGGTLQVDSEPGEGTRIELRFDHAST